MHPAPLLDTVTVFDTLLSAAPLQNITPIQDFEPDSYSEVPLVTWQVANNGQYAHGLWQVTLILNVIADPRETFAICRDLYSTIHSWAHPELGIVPGVGGVEQVIDGAAFDKVGTTSIHGKHLAQYAATFTIHVQGLP